MKTLTILYYFDKNAQLSGKTTRFTTKCENLQEAKEIVSTFDYVVSWSFE